MYFRNNIQGYAIALYDLVKESKKQKDIHYQLASLSENMENGRELINFLSSYDLTLEKKKKFIDEVFEDFDEIVKNMMKLLVDRQMFATFPRILKHYFKFSDKELNIKFGIIYTTIPLSPNKIKDIAKKISNLYKFDCVLINRIDPTLISGFKIKIDSLTIENNIQTSLNELKDIMLTRGEEND